MSEQSTAPARDATATRRDASTSGPRRSGNALSRLWHSLVVFLRQIMDELRKVVRPTRSELTTYTTVVIAFVAVIMLLVFGLDSLITRIVFWVFAGS